MAAEKDEKPGRKLDKRRCELTSWKGRKNPPDSSEDDINHVARNARYSLTEATLAQQLQIRVISLFLEEVM